MLSAGKYHTLTVNRISDYGLYLADEEGNEVLLPNRFVALADKVGDQKDVFVYHDSEDRIVASTEHPYATVGQVGYLKVVGKNEHGAFVDWGLKAKDLFVPNRNMKFQMNLGEKYLLYVYEDTRTGRAVGTTKLNDYIRNDRIEVKQGDKVDIIIGQSNELGHRVVINQANWGMIYNNQIFRPVSIGDAMEGYIDRITEDNRIDVALQKSGYDGVKSSADELLALLASKGGTLPIGDNSPPEEIASLTRMSKKVFKRSVGYLLKRGDIEISGNQIKIKQ